MASPDKTPPEYDAARLGAMTPVELKEIGHCELCLEAWLDCRCRMRQTSIRLAVLRKRKEVSPVG